MLSLLRFCCCLVTKACLTVLQCYGLHTPVRMVIIKKSTNNKLWRGYAEKEILLHCLWESTLIQPLCRTVWRFLKKLWIELPCVCACSVMSDSATPWTAAGQAPLTMVFSRKEHWSGSPFPSPEDLPKPGIEPISPALGGWFSTTKPSGKPPFQDMIWLFHIAKIRGEISNYIICPPSSWFIFLYWSARSCLSNIKFSFIHGSVSIICFLNSFLIYLNI